MYDRVNQLETKRGESNLARTACPLQASPHPSSSFIEAFSPSTDISALSTLSLYLTPTFNSASLLYKLSSPPKTMSWFKGEPLVAITLDVLLQPQIICIVSVNYSPHSSSCRARDIPVCLCLREGLGGWWGWYSSSLDHIVLCCFSVLIQFNEDRLFNIARVLHAGDQQHFHPCQKHSDGTLVEEQLSCCMFVCVQVHLKELEYHRYHFFFSVTEFKK